ncbi:MbnP family protein [Dyadobacter psychrotolerans]|uniref:Copper-binding protein MbnP-like domain-containing protein n=1 Tax=Dyadobacter psychrotolerans TaxID=2541721 RepID=A0A4R5DI12_9BACT|nr:MbnP family protein [Dyadobacter psychrotolerans]TDE11580.1 hypothetical protein E0F88_24415 [Dyadobacter psychrotolerans]
MKRIFSFCLYLFSGITFLSFNSCESDPTPTGAGFSIEFDNVVGTKNLVLNGPSNVNSTGEDFVITKFNYFISNIKLTRANGTSYVVPQDSSYFLIMEENKESQFVKLKNVPVGDYTGVEFMVGVDSARSVSPVEKRKGVLDPGGSMEDGMYWAWNSGYIFMKLEGTSPAATSANSKFYYHIGLFGGYQTRTVNNTRVVKIDFAGQKATVSAEEIPEVHLLVDVLKIFDGPATRLSIAKYSSVMSQLPEKSQEIANNYSKMFSLDHIHN